MKLTMTREEVTVYRFYFEADTQEELIQKAREVAEQDNIDEYEFEAVTDATVTVEVELESGAIEEVDLDDFCECGAPNDDGEGWDGKCGNCADREEMKSEGE